MEVQNLFGFEGWLKRKQRESKLLGSLFLLSACGIAMAYLGTGAGIFTFLIALMTIGSLTILLTPLGILNKATFLVTSVFSLMLEFLI